MHFQSTAAVALFGSLAVAGPLEQRAAKKSFVVDQVGIEQAVLPPAVQVLRTYQKYMKNPPTKVAIAANAALQSGSVVASPQSYDLAYLSQVTIGGQQFTLNFDTGSADLWVYSTLQSSDQTSGRTVYDPTLSNTSSVMSGQTWKITYGDGSGAAGKVYADTVVIGGVTATSQAVEAATSVSQQFLNDQQSGGLVGLAFSNLNTVRPNQQTTFFDTVKSSLAAKLFTADLKKGAPGTYGFGFIDSSKYSGSITYAPIQAGTGFWQFAMGGYTIGGQSANTTSMGNGIADTGTTLLYLPDAVASSYWANVVGAYYSNQFGAYIFPCASPMPTFSINISGRDFVIQGNYLNYAPISNTMCFGGLQSNSGIGFSILGDIFLKSVFAVFDMSQASPRIGFANKAGDTSATSASSSGANSAASPASASVLSSATPTTTPVASSPSTTLATTTTTVKIVSSSLTTPITTASSRSSNTSKSTTTAPKKSTTTTTRKPTTTTTTKKVTTTRRKAIKAKTTTTKRKSNNFAKKLSSCNSKYIAAIKKKYPVHPVRFCRNYKPKSGARSVVPGIPSSAAIVKVCKCWLSTM